MDAAVVKPIPETCITYLITVLVCNDFVACNVPGLVQRRSRHGKSSLMGDTTFTTGISTIIVGSINRVKN